MSSNVICVVLKETKKIVFSFRECSFVFSFKVCQSIIEIELKTRLKSMTANLYYDRVQLFQAGWNSKFWTSVDNLDSPFTQTLTDNRCPIWFSLWFAQLEIFEKIEDKSCPSWLPVNHPLPEAQGTRLGSLCQPCPACTEYNLRQKCLIFMEFVILIWTASHFK